ncbi:TPA: hypothetical protein MH415_30865 [Klebsiella pneumoniae]|nr:hypothetical protein [Klebsiella pneumoniae]HBX5339167.1 hypothetical protein [Klebsiella pneumoniae]
MKQRASNSWPFFMPGVYVFWWVGKFLSSDQQVKLATSIRQNRWRGGGAFDPGLLPIRGC